MNFSTERKKAPPTTVLAAEGVCVTCIFDGTNQGEALYIIRNLLRYIINTQCCISSSRRENTRWRVMRYSPKGADNMHRTLCGDDMPSLRLG